MTKKFVLKNHLHAVLQRTQGTDIDIAGTISLMHDALTADNIEHHIFDMGNGCFVIQAGNQSVQVQAYHTIKPREFPPVIEPLLTSRERPNHAGREFRHAQEQKYRAMARHFNTRRK